MRDQRVGAHYLDDEIPPDLYPGYERCQLRREQASLAASNGDFAKAIELYRVSLEWCKSNLPTNPMHSMTVWHQGEIGIMLQKLGNLNEALVHVGEAFDYRDALDPEGKLTLRLLDAYAHVLEEMGQLELAAGKYQTLWERQEYTLGHDNEETVQAGYDAARLWFDVGLSKPEGIERTKCLDKATELHRDILWIRTINSADAFQVIESRIDLAVDYIELARYGEASNLLHKNMDELCALRREKSLPDDQQAIEGIESVVVEWLEEIEDRLREAKRREEELRLLESQREKERLRVENILTKIEEKMRVESTTRDEDQKRLMIDQPITHSTTKNFGLGNPVFPNCDGKEQHRTLSPKPEVPKPRFTGEERCDNSDEKPLKSVAIHRPSSSLEHRPRKDQDSARRKSTSELASATDSDRQPPDNPLVRPGSSKQSRRDPQIITPKSPDPIHIQESPAVHIPPETVKQNVTEAQDIKEPSFASSIPEIKIEVSGVDDKSKPLVNIIGAFPDHEDGEPHGVESPGNHEELTPRLGDSKSSIEKIMSLFRNPTPTVREINMEPQQRINVQDELKDGPLENDAQKEALKPESTGTQCSEKETGAAQVKVDSPGTGNDARHTTENTKPRSNGHSAATSPKAKTKPKGSICDAAPQLEGDSQVDVWLDDIRRINEDIFDMYRRQAGKRVKVGILDTGIDMRNDAFKVKTVQKRIKKRVDFLNPSGDALDLCGHGTHCAGLLNRIAPAADLYIGRVAVDFASGLDEDVVAKGIRRALSPKGPGEASENWDVDILSLSLGFYPFSEAVEAALNESMRKGKLVLAAVSNHGTRRKISYPAWASGVIAVNSATGFGQPSPFNPPPSPEKNLSILGERVVSAWICTTPPTTNSNSLAAVINTSATRYMSGTSVATPIAAGIVSLLLEATMLDVPDDPETQEILRKALPLLRRYEGIMEVLRSMSVPTGKFRNIVPINLLDPDKSLAEIARDVKAVLGARFGAGVWADDT